MKSAMFAVCLAAVTLASGAKAQAQGLVVGIPTYVAPVYAAPVYASPIYQTVYAAPAYATAYYPPVYPSVTAYYSAPAVAYAAPYAVAAPVVVGAPVRAYGYWGRHHGHVYYRW